ncbi:MAG: 5-methyltetrahydrofolate--homocysteine methyltransferase [Bacteroidales bacterium]|nr:5-methyltetrahydrofolate--homocysteine methyltransferase [Bacteroidales bacterium]
MEIELLILEKERVTVSPNSIPPLLGTTEVDLDSHTGDLIETYIAECRSIMDPRGAYARIQAITTDSKEDIEIEGTRFRTGKIIRNMLRNAEEYAFFVVTAGPEPEALSRSLINSGQFLEGYIVDLVASGIVESAANQVHRHIKDVAGSEGMKITNRYSPGYCSWPVNEQQKLFSLLPNGCCGITLSESSLMSPIKSVSGIIGIGRSMEYKDYTCEICPMKECIFRQIIQRESGLS